VLFRSRSAATAERAVGAGADPDTTFPTAPGPWCSWCDFRGTCPDGARAPAKEQWAGVLRDSG